LVPERLRRWWQPCAPAGLACASTAGRPRAASGISPGGHARCLPTGTRPRRRRRRLDTHRSHPLTPERAAGRTARRAGWRSAVQHRPCLHRLAGRVRGAHSGEHRCGDHSLPADPVAKVSDSPTTGDLAGKWLPTSGFPAICERVSPCWLAEYPTGLDGDTEARDGDTPRVTTRRHSPAGAA